MKKLEHHDPTQRMKNRWPLVVGETPTHWLVIIHYVQGGDGTILHACAKTDWSVVGEETIEDLF